MLFKSFSIAVCECDVERVAVDIARFCGFPLACGEQYGIFVGAFYEIDFVAVTVDYFLWSAGQQEFAVVEKTDAVA